MLQIHGSSSTSSLLNLSKLTVTVVECKDVRLHIPTEHGTNLPISNCEPRKPTLAQPYIQQSIFNKVTQTFMQMPIIQY